MNSKDKDVNATPPNGSSGDDGSAPSPRKNSAGGENPGRRGDGAGRDPTRERADWIGRELRGVYEETLNEALPDRFTELLRKLRDSEQSK